MSRISSFIPRSAALLTSDRLLSSLRRTQLELNREQEAISTGKSVNKPSDVPSKTPAILAIQESLEAREQHDMNLQHALGVLNNVDAAYSDATDIILESVSVASSQIGVGTSPETRANQAVVIDQQLNGLINIANRQFQGVSLFGGRTTVGITESVFRSHLGGVRYIGSQTNLEGDVGLNEPLAFNSNGDEAFGAISARVVSQVDLDPQATASTRLDDVHGALGRGVRIGSVVVTTDGNAIKVDLSTSDALNDVLVRINEAIKDTDPTAGSLLTSGSGFALAANSGHTIQISELGVGQAATDLGILLTANNTTVTGDDIDPKLSLLTETSSLGASIDLISGLRISQGGVTAIADFSSAVTIQDMINVVDQLDLGLRMQINSQQTGLDLLTDLSGTQLSVGENNGGATAESLGVRTFGLSTQLADFRFDLGVSGEDGAPDFEMRLHSGTTFQVNIDGVETVGELISEMMTQAVGAGLNVGSPGDTGSDFNVGLATDGNGFQFEDNTVGPGDFQIVQLGISLAATDLGIKKNAQSGNTILGDDQAQVRVESPFTHLILLSGALRSNNELGITIVGERLERSLESMTNARADAAVRSQQVQQQQNRSATLRLAELTILSDLQDADLAQVITRFTQLTQQLEASLAIGAQSLRLSLLDFLR